MNVVVECECYCGVWTVMVECVDYCEICRLLRSVQVIVLAIVECVELFSSVYVNCGVCAVIVKCVGFCGVGTAIVECVGYCEVGMVIVECVGLFRRMYRCCGMCPLSWGV